MLAQFFARTDLISLFRDAATEAGAEFVEIILETTRADAIRRFNSRVDQSAWGRHNVTVVEAMGGDSALGEMHEQALTIPDSWPGAAPDGTNYPEWITWTEIVPPERIALLHGEYRDDPKAFSSILTFEEEGAGTRVEMITVFPTKEQRDEAAEKFRAVEGGQQTLGNLATYVAQLAQKEDV